MANFDQQDDEDRQEEGDDMINDKSLEDDSVDI